MLTGDGWLLLLTGEIPPVAAENGNSPEGVVSSASLGETAETSPPYERLLLVNDEEA